MMAREVHNIPTSVYLCLNPVALKNMTPRYIKLWNFEYLESELAALQATAILDQIN